VGAGQGQVTLLSEEGQLLEELTEEEADIARKRVLETLRQLYEDGNIQTYFGSVQARHEPDEEDAADDIEMEEGELVAEADLEEPPPIYVPTERETAAAAKQAPSRKRFAYLIAAGCVAGAVLVTIGVLHFAMRDQPRTLQERKAGHDRRRDLSLSGAGKTVVVQHEKRAISEEQTDTTRDQALSGQLLVPGESLSMAADDVEAILLLPAVEPETGNVAQIEASPGSELSREETSSPALGDEPAPGALILRLGRVRTAILKDGFAVRSPLVEVTGKRGAVFAMRVVLDASTTVEVELGAVVIRSLRGDVGSFHLVKGQRGHFDAAGGEVIDGLMEQE